MSTALTAPAPPIPLEDPPPSPSLSSPPLSSPPLSSPPLSSPSLAGPPLPGPQLSGSSLPSSALPRPPARPLPRRPYLLPGLPVLARGPGEALLGTDPRHAVVLSGLSDPLLADLRALDGQRTTEQLVTRSRDRGEDPAAVVDLLGDLTDAGLIDDATAGPPVPRLAADAATWALRTGRPAAPVPASRATATVVVHGNGRLAVATAALLVTCGVTGVRVVATGTVAPTDTGSGYLESDIGRPRAAAAADAVRRARPDPLPPHPSPDARPAPLPARPSDARRHPLPARPSPEALPLPAAARLRPDLVVLADALVPCPQLTSALVADGLPHLAVRVREGTGLVGPLVLPGRTSCLRCADLHRTDRDPCWPTVAAQLADRTQNADLITTQATAALAVGQVLLALEAVSDTDVQPPTWNATLELDALTGTLEHRGWPPHPDCDCRRNGLV